MAKVPPCPSNVSVASDVFCYPEQIETIADYSFVTPVLLAIYMLFGNVILLNLLIAIFS